MGKKGWSQMFLMMWIGYISTVGLLYMTVESNIVLLVVSGLLIAPILVMTIEDIVQLLNERYIAKR